MKRWLRTMTVIFAAASLTACSQGTAGSGSEAEKASSEAASGGDVSGEGVSGGANAAEAGSGGAGYPEKTIEVVIPFNAGSNTDTQYRFIQQYLEKQLGVSTAVVNNGGASGVIGTTGFLQEPADGYTVLFSLPTPTVYKPASGETEYAVEDLKEVARVSGAPMYLVVKNDSQFTTGTDLIDYIKANPDAFTYGNAGNGGIAHLAFASFLQGEGLKATSVPFSGGTADCYTAVMGGHVQSYVAGEQDLAGREDVRPLINLGTKSETEGFADVPTLEELGYPGYVTDNFSGFYFSKEIPDEIVTVFGDAVKAMMEDPEFQEAAKAQNFAVSYAGAEEFTAQVEDTVKMITPVLEALKQ